MAVKIRLKRLGKIRSPHFRIVVIDSRKKRDGRAIEEIGLYHPKNDPSFIQVDSERAQYWLSVGAQPSEAVVAIFKRTGDWQTFSGDKTPSGVDPQPEKANKTDAFNAALAASKDEPGSQAISKSKKGDDAKADKKADEPKAEAKAADAKADDAKADDAKTDDAKDYGTDSFRGETPPAGFEIKGNEDSMKFHAPESPWYDRTIAEVWFKTAEAATAAGFVNAVADKAESADSDSSESASSASDSSGA